MFMASNSISQQMDEKQAMRLGEAWTLGRPGRHMRAAMKADGPSSMTWREGTPG